MSFWLSLFVSLAFGAPAPVVLLQDPAELASLVLPLSRFLGAELAADNAALYRQSAAYRALVDSVAADLTQLKAKDPLLDVTMAKSHRLFDVRWLKAPEASFELVGVSNRLDRHPFRPEKCGEVRLVYRLAYRKSAELHSRLPMTVNVVHWIEGDCAAAAIAWSGDLSAAPLSALALSPARLKSVEINLQSVRWPSTARGDLGGHAEYFLRVFKPVGNTLTLDTMENTPDVERIAASPALKARLKKWIGENLARLDVGTAVLPDEFLVRKATSVSPRGLTRLANRPFSQLFSPKDFSTASFAKLRFVRSPKALLRRLDDLSCVGCHQGRSVAGFHLLGIDSSKTLPGNAIAVSGSPHLLGDLGRRRAFVTALAAGTPPEAARPFSERADEAEGGYGSHCGLGDPGFAEWTCKAGFKCQPIALAAGDDSVGQCFPEKVQVGDPCEVGRMLPNADSHRDRVTGAKATSCGDGVCEANEVGFPDGMCARDCEKAGGEVRCGSIAELTGFNGCLGAGKPFPACLKEHVRPAGLRACGDEAPCRDDYLCTGAAQGGVCLPPYFLFQMRLDGHPKPLQK